ncbi:hypothetical protein [Streptomyces canus]|uniref:hypothetical protein n=1 Tax=Streptomyces canus TaxID=58343 RepID=UPI002781DBE0|nr:hypothetical protein [Streptomyces canus]MDQ0765617.1 hypothetical protein [Streptomyces canus]
MVMNRYGRAALAHWREHLPGQYGMLPDPLAYFTRLGEKTERQAGELTDAMALDGTPVGGETGEQRSRWLLAVRGEAEQVVLRELIRPPAAPSPDDATAARDLTVPLSPI